MSAFEDMQAFAKTQEANQNKCRQFVARYFNAFSSQTGWPEQFITFRTTTNKYESDVSAATFNWEHGFMVFETNISLDGQSPQMIRLFKVRFDLSSNLINYKFIVGTVDEAPADVEPKNLQHSFESVIEEFQAILAHDRPSALPDRSKDVFDQLRDAVQGK